MKIINRFKSLSAGVGALVCLALLAFQETETITVTLADDGEDKTAELRKILQEDFDTLQFTQGRSELKITANGMLPGDAENYQYGDVGRAGVLRIENRTGLVIKGKSKDDKTYLATTEPAISEDQVFDRTHHLSSRRSFLKTVESETISYSNLIVGGLNTEEGSKPGLPVYDKEKAFEHAYDIEGSQNVLFENCEAEYVFGDGFYIRQGTQENRNITIKNCRVNWNGRQGVAMVSGSNILIDNLEVTGSRRSGIDIEPNSPKQTVDGVVVRNSDIRCRLFPFPMGGNGMIRNVLIEGNTYESSAGTTHVRGKGDTISRENIIFRGNTRKGEFGSPRSCYLFWNASNILIENEVCALQPRAGKIIYLENCRNVVIRNNDFPNAKVIVLKNTDPSEVKVYGNKQELKFLILKEGEDDSRKDTSGAIPIKEYDVEKHGEPEIPGDPEFIAASSFQGRND